MEMRTRAASSRMKSRFAVLVALALFVFASAPVSAQTRAWFDRDRIELGETTTLNIETDQPSVPSPDYAPLLRDFNLSGNSSSRTIEDINGVARTRVLFAVALRPRREGVLAVPSLQVGNQRTQPLSLSVTAATATPARAGQAVFIEAETDAQDPYVQQAVGYVVRLYYALPLVSGRLDAQAPDGASMQQVGDDIKYTRSLGGRDYTVLERRYLLVPERSGTLVVPGVRFDGQGVGGFFDDLFGDGRRDLAASSAPRYLRVRPAPANAPQPWLPLRALDLRYVETPRSARVGDASTVTVEATADGATAAQMPALQMDAGDGAQVFADPAQVDETFVEGRPRVRITRKFSIVPARAGALLVPGARMDWWDVRAGIARTASVADLSLQVAPGANDATSAPSAGSVADGAAEGAARDWIRVPFVQGAVRPWALGTVVFALLWLATLWWGLHRRMHAGQPPATATRSDAQSARAAPARSGDALRRALERGDLGDIADALLATADPPATDLDALRTRLDDLHQVDAVAALQQARWGSGDAAAARTRLREAFRNGPRWRTQAKTGKPLLPPLYPDG